MRKPSWNSVRVRYVDRPAVLSALAEIAWRLGHAHPEVVEVRLFGSMARGERNVYADADLLIVLETSDLPLKDRSPVYRPSESPVPLDLTVCTRAEMERELAAGNRFVQRIVAESRVLFARNDETAATPGVTAE